MANSSTPKPPKGYTPVPTTERIDDDVENPQQAGDVSDDDEMYETSAPLLGNRTRGNEPIPHHEHCWYHSVTHKLSNIQNRFRDRQPDFIVWTRPYKTHSWRKICFILIFIALVLGTIAGLATSTTILAGKLKQCQNTRWRRPYDRTRGYQTRMPKNHIYTSSNNRLDFPALYPPLSPDKSPNHISISTCEAAWRRLRYIPCHEKIWNRSWDDGKRHSLFDPDISLYADAICTSSCLISLQRSLSQLRTQCTSEDTFIMEDYTGPFSLDTKLESGPLEVIQTITNRVDHICRVDPDTLPPVPYRGRGYYEHAFCPAVLWTDWSIVDGMNAGNLEGLDTFARLTNTSKTTYTHRREQVVNDQCDNVDSVTSSLGYVGYKHFGPGQNETSCGWCLLDWFERKGMAWDENVRDPATGEKVGLKEYLARINDMGERCESEGWEKVWKRIMQKWGKELGEDGVDNCRVEGDIRICFEENMDEEGVKIVVEEFDEEWVERMGEKARLQLESLRATFESEEEYRKYVVEEDTLVFDEEN